MAKSESKTVVLVPVQTVVVFRDGKQIAPALGQPFEFTAEEAEQIKAMNPAAVSDVAVVPAEQAVAPKVDEGL